MRGRGWIWPAALIALLVASAAANIGLMIVANEDASFAVEPDYYRKAVDWDHTMAQQAANEALGWHVTMRLEPSAAGRARITVDVRDAAGMPVDGATVDVEAFPSVRAREVSALALKPSGDGLYAGELPRDRAGLWEVRIAVARGRDRFTQTLTQDLAQAADTAIAQAASPARGPHAR